MKEIYYFFKWIFCELPSSVGYIINLEYYNYRIRCKHRVLCDTCTPSLVKRLDEISNMYEAWTKMEGGPEMMDAMVEIRIKTRGIYFDLEFYQVQLLTEIETLRVKYVLLGI